MKIFENLFSAAKRPTLNKENISVFEKVVAFIAWFVKNDPIATSINNKSSHIIFKEGYNPSFGTERIPELTNLKENTIIKWFAIKFFHDINKLKDANQKEFEQFIDNLVTQSGETIRTAGNIAIKYDVNFQNFDYEKEIEKISAGIDRELFKENFFKDSVLGAEIRIIAYLYYDYFGEWYKNKK